MSPASVARCGRPEPWRENALLRGFVAESQLNSTSLGSRVAMAGCSVGHRRVLGGAGQACSHTNAMARMDRYGAGLYTDYVQPAVFSLGRESEAGPCSSTEPEGTAFPELLVAGLLDVRVSGRRVLVI